MELGIEAQSVMMPKLRLITTRLKGGLENLCLHRFVAAFDRPGSAVGRAWCMRWRR